MVGYLVAGYYKEKSEFFDFVKRLVNLKVQQSQCNFLGTFTNSDHFLLNLINNLYYTFRHKKLQ